MKRREFLAASLAATLCATVNPALKPVFADGSAKKKLLYYDRSNGFIHPSTVIDSKTGMSVGGRVLTELGKKLGYEVVCTKDGRIFDEDLSQYDAFLMNCCGTLTGDGGGDGPNAYPMSKEGEQNFYAAVRNGAGVIGFHNATDTNKSGAPSQFENAPLDKRTEYTKLIGAEFLTHGSQQKAKLKFVKPGELPSINDIPEVHEEWYVMRNFNPDLHVILVQDTENMDKSNHNASYDRPSFPSTWIRKEGKGRVAYTSLAHNNSTWETEWMQALTLDLLKFITGKLDLDTTPNLNEATPGYEIIRNQK